MFSPRAYEDGGIHEAIADYEDAVFFDILAEGLPGAISARTATILPLSPRVWTNTWMNLRQTALKT